jgi:hypothetical protein
MQRAQKIVRSILLRVNVRSLVLSSPSGVHGDAPACGRIWPRNRRLLPLTTVQKVRLRNHSIFPHRIAHLGCSTRLGFGPARKLSLRCQIMLAGFLFERKGSDVVVGTSVHHRAGGVRETRALVVWIDPPRKSNKSPGQARQRVRLWDTHDRARASGERSSLISTRPWLSAHSRGPKSSLF